MNDTPEQIETTIAALEAQRTLLGDAVVDTALAPLRRELASQRAGGAAAQQLKQVSVLFVDVVGSTAMGQRLQPEDIHAVMDGALERFTAVVQDNRGRVLQYTGDGMLAAFGADESHEDDAESAVLAGLGIIEEARREAPRVHQAHGIADFNVRAGINFSASQFVATSDAYTFTDFSFTPPDASGTGGGASFTAAAVPEPPTWAIVFIGMLLLGMLSRPRQRAVRRD